MRSVPWLSVSFICAFSLSLPFTRIPVVSRILAQPDGLWRLTVPQIFRVEGVTFLVLMALGKLPALFSLPAGLGDIAIGVEAVFVARNLDAGSGRPQRGVVLHLGPLQLVARPRYWFRRGAPPVGCAGSPSTGGRSRYPLALIPAVISLAAALYPLSLQADGRRHHATSL
jgi:hypothetical protein